MSKRMLGSTSKLVAAVLSLVVVPAALAGCASQTPSGPHELKVVTSTSVWGSIVEAIAGDKVQVTSIVHNPNQDPHSFEASVRDQAAVNSADLVLLTGNGYDNFMNPLIAASHQPKGHIVALAPNDTKVTPAYGHTVTDPHVWYDLSLVAKIAKSITTKLSEAATADASDFEAGNTRFQKSLASIAARLEKASYRYRCHTLQPVGAPPCKNLANTSILQPESVGLRLIAKFATDITPQSVRRAVMNETDISVQDMALLKTMFFGKIDKQGLGFAANTPVDWLVLNSQQTNAQTNQLVGWAKKSNMTHIVTFSESLPAGETYLTWMAANVAQIEAIRASEPI